MRSILVAIAARIHYVSRIHHGNGTLTHYRGCGTTACAGIAAAAAHGPGREDHANSAHIRPACRLVIEATVNL